MLEEKRYNINFNIERYQHLYLCSMAAGQLHTRHLQSLNAAHKPSNNSFQLKTKSLDRCTAKLWTYWLKVTTWLTHNLYRILGIINTGMSSETHFFTHKM
ncbi:hypothetical protein PVK06_005357 [Gossypium arboreum]|uniref:Uncharacterized protein n=1 Tax=Gossypium arboreum TaxID=29729 RepID=A0ABR0QUE2_GOSAR|nr:hypothetical protein PVK06_005357 [Gossypium arboreum]